MQTLTLERELGYGVHASLRDLAKSLQLPIVTLTLAGASDPVEFIETIRTQTADRERGMLVLDDADRATRNVHEAVMLAMITRTLDLKDWIVVRLVLPADKPAVR